MAEGNTPLETTNYTHLANKLTFRCQVLAVYSY